MTTENFLLCNQPYFVVYFVFTFSLLQIIVIKMFTGKLMYEILGKKTYMFFSIGMNNMYNAFYEKLQPFKK